MTLRSRRAVVVAAALSLAAALGLTSCSGSNADAIDYAVDGTLITYNTNTTSGAASGGPQAFARVLTGFNYHGRSEEHTSELQSLTNIVCRLLLEKKKK